MTSKRLDDAQAAADMRRLIDGRYEVERVLGAGGMSVVYAVRDRRTGGSCALKLFSPEKAADRKQMAAFFEREYAVLAQLAHPGIITVHDYGIADNAAYYTMELLEGEELRRLAPLPWQQLCKLLREVASALALLHSRRLIHRDATANNVRYGADGHAKLIDFGAMIDMGMADQIVGTPPYIPPEALYRMPLDGRADLYALGALAYYGLTRRHAYPASSVHELSGCWESPPRPPSDYAPDVPKALDELVLSLLDLDVRVRPSTAGEVIERLSALADLPGDRRLAVAQAYLATPSLVGREPHVQRARGYLQRALRAHGGSLLIEAEAGLGRSRLLANYGLEARLCGALTLQLNAKGHDGSDFAVLRAAVRQLLDVAPELTIAAAREHAAILGQVIPELQPALGDQPLTAASDHKALLVQAQAAAHAFFCELARERCLVIAVDDVEHADSASLLFLAELAHAAPSRALLLVSSARSGGTAELQRALSSLRSASVRVALEPLTAAENEKLLRSLFGEVRNLSLVAGWVNALAQGNPEAVMSLAQHMVDRGLARYEGGTWILPGHEYQQELPESLFAALHARVEALSPAARRLAETLSLVVENVPIDLASYGDLLRGFDALQAHAALAELVARRILVAGSRGYAFAHAELAAVLRSGIDDERRVPLHRALAEAYLAREQPLIAAHHLGQAADPVAACHAALRWCDQRIQEHRDFTGFWSSRAGVRVLADALRVAEEQGLPPHRLFRLRRHLLQLAVYVDIPFAELATRVLEQLSADTGIERHRADGEVDALQCLKLAQARYDALPESERGLPPFVALRELAMMVVALSGAYGRQLDLEAMNTLPIVLAPFRSLGVLLALLFDITSAAVDRVRGRRFSDHIAPLLARLEQPIPGLDEVTRHGARRTLTYYLALEQAQLCSPAVLAHADFIGKDPAFEAQAEHLRMLKHLYSGEVLQASACRERIELLMLRHSDSAAQLATSILYETEAHTLNADLIAIKTSLPQLEALAQRSPCWRTFWWTIRGEYEMLRGQHERACAEFEEVLSIAQPGEHTAWSRTASSYVAALVARGAYAQAIEFGEQACAASALHRVNPLYGVLLRTSVARAYAESGDHATGQREIERVLSEALELGMTGVPLGHVHEAAARVALRAGDVARCDAALEQARVHYTRGGAASLLAKFQRLTADVLRRGAAADPEPVRRSIAPAVTRAADFSREWSAGQTVEERARVALSLLLEECAASAGCLYSSRPSGLHALAALGEFDTLESIRQARAQLDEALEPREQTEAVSNETVTVKVVPRARVAQPRSPVQTVLLTALVANRTVVTGVVTLWNLPPKRELPWPLLHAISAALLESRAVEPLLLPDA